jgi:plasmid stabilization system protein ParE
MKNNSYKVCYLPIFEKDLTNIIEYIVYNLKNRDAAISLLEKIENAILERTKNPLAFEKYNSIRERKYPYYRIYVGNFVIYYVVIEDVIEIRRIIYGKRNTDKLI